MRIVSSFALRNVSTEMRIRAQLSTCTSLDIAQFWNDVKNLSTPLIAESNGIGKFYEVTFLWRSEKPLLSVYVRLNRVTDKRNVTRGLMTRIPSSDIWTLTLRLPATYRGSYSIIEIPQGTTPEQMTALGGRFSPLTGQSDPLNKAPSINSGSGVKESILSLKDAPEQNEWIVLQGTYSGKLISSYSLIASRKRRIRTYFPDVANTIPLGLLVLPDAETWFDRIGVLEPIDIAIKNGRINPIAVLGIDNLDESDRSTILGGNSEFILNIVDNLIPQLRENYPDRVWAGRSKTVFAGQSLGGVSALMAALYATETFGSIICHSPSMWWSPDRDTPPFRFTENDISWVSKRVLSRPPKKVQINLCVGSLEGATVSHVQQLHQGLLASGVESVLSIYSGGHDYAWWRGALLDGLATL